MNLNDSDELNWQVQRYAAGDESFDRDAFELQMIEDPALALAVAEAVRELDEIAQATLQNSVQSNSGPSRANSLARPESKLRDWWKLVAGISAVLLVGFFISREMTGGTQRAFDEMAQEPLSDVAENWLVLNEIGSDEASMIDPQPADLFEMAPLMDLEDDWITDAAFDLYAELDG